MSWSTKNCLLNSAGRAGLRQAHAEPCWGGRLNMGAEEVEAKILYVPLRRIQEGQAMEIEE